MANDPRIGTISESAGIQYPTQTVSGQPVTDRNGMGIHNIGAGRFVLFDMTFPPGFDLDATLAELKGAATVTSNVKPASTQGGLKPNAVKPEGTGEG